MNPLEIIYVLASVTAFYVLFYRMKAAEARMTRLENQQPVDLKRKLPESVQPGLAMYPPIENFTPKKPETLRPNQVRGREVDQNVYEFDTKISL
jgi:hypothetical protein